MMQIELFYNTRQKAYFFVGRANCFHCKKDIFPITILRACWSKKGREMLHYHPECIKHFNDNRHILYESKNCLVSDVIPPNSTPILIRPPEMSKGELSVFEASELKSDSVVDRTVHANRQSWVGSSVGKPLEQLYGNEDDGTKYLEYLEMTTPKKISHKSIKEIKEMAE